MPHEQIAQYHGKMLNYLRKCFSRLDDADLEDAVQTVFVEVLARRADFVPANAKWETYLCQAAFNAARGIWKQRERGWFKSLGGELEAGEKDSPALTPIDDYGHPDIVAVEVERRGRQQLLLSDILQEYALRCEQQNMQTQREIYERRLRGQDAKLIMASMGVARNNIDKHLERAREWINDRMQQADVEKSVFQTVLRGQNRDIPQLPNSVPTDVPRNGHEVLMRVVNEFGALCPSDERLTQFEQEPQAVEFSDLRYHIQEVPCPLCQARRLLK